MWIRGPFIALVLAAPLAASAQQMSDEEARARMQEDLRFLASDRLEGRETATPFERMAADHIIEQFRAIGLSPEGDSATYLQPFPFAGQPYRGPKNILQVGRNTLKEGIDYWPLSSSASANVFTRVARCRYGIVAPQLGRNDVDGVAVKDHAAVFSISTPDGVSPHSKWSDYNDIRVRIDTLIGRGANAILVYNDDPKCDDPDSSLAVKVQPCPVPVLFLTKEGFKKVGLDGDPVVINTDIVRPTRIGHNVLGYLDNGKPYTVVIGAHYDHLGHGIEGSLWRGEPAIHNGADDNASGVAMLLQLARDLKVMPGVGDNNYLFIAFSGEELGLFGSNWWTKHPTLPLSTLNYMINMDMVGRLDSAGDLAINGVGTSPAWARLRPDTTVKAEKHTRTKPRTKSTPEPLRIKTSESGVGPSDHTSFYLQDIPAIHFFTGAHEDYHKPSDDEDKINYDGMVRVMRYIEQLITDLDHEGKLAFTRTAADTTEVPQFKVTLGVVPDYMYDGKGMRIDGVTDGKTAAAAGLKPGDVVTRLGDHEVTDMMSYMKALAAFNKGDATVVTVARDGKPLKVNITFK